MNSKISEKYIELATTNSSRRKRKRKKWGRVVRGGAGGTGGTRKARRKRNGQTNTRVSETTISQPAYYKQYVRTKTSL